MERLCREPSLTQLLADPMIQALMASDGVERRDLDEIIENARRHIERTRGDRMRGNSQSAC